MADPYDSFSPDATVRRPVSLAVIHRDASEEEIPAGGVVFAEGANLAFRVSEDTDEVTVEVAPGIGNEDPYYRQKYNALVALNETNDSTNPLEGPYAGTDGVIPYGLDWSFTSLSIWLAALNNNPGDYVSGAGFLSNGICGNFGEFVTNDGYPQYDPAELAVLDVCAPCMDCLIYSRLGDYLNRISAFYDYNLELITNQDTDTPPVHPDGDTPEVRSGLLPQVQASMRMWDYLLHNSSVKFSAAAQGQSIVTAIYYKNVSNAAVGVPPNGITMELFYTFQRNGVNWDGITDALIDTRLLARDGSDNPPDNIRAYTISTSFPNAYTVRVILTTFDSAILAARNLPSGGSLYADVALLVTDLTLFDDGGNYTVDICLNISPTHLITAGNPTGALDQCKLVYFTPPAPESSE